MKIGMFSETYLPTPDGVANQLFQLKRAFEKKGHDVHIFTSGTQIKTVRDNLNSGEHVYTFYGLALPQYPQYRAPLFPYPAIRAMAREIDLDVVHIHSPFMMGGAGYLAARALDVPLVATYHTNVVDMAHDMGGALVSNDALLGLAWRFTRGLYKRCDAVTVPTALMKSYLETHGIFSNVDVVWNGVTVDDFDGQTKTIDIHEVYETGGSTLITYVGRISKDKCVDTLIDAVALLSATHDVVALIGGIGPEKKALERRVSERGLGHIIKLLGYVEEAHKPALLAQSDVVVLPSKADTFGIALIEAMACETAVIGADAGGIPDIITDGENGLLVPVNDVQALADALRGLLDDPGKKQALARAGKADVLAKYSIDQCADRMLAIYREHGEHIQ